jgi:hypothetical protein
MCGKENAANMTTCAQIGVDLAQLVRMCLLPQGLVAPEGDQYAK